MLTVQELQSDCVAVLFQTVDDVHLLAHVNGGDFDHVATINRQAVIGANSRQFGRGVFILLILATVDFFMTATHDHLDDDDFAGVVMLVRTSKTHSTAHARYRHQSSYLS